MRCLLGLAGGVRNLVSGGSDNVGNKTPKRILTEDELNLIGGADVRGLPGSDVASSILPPSEVENGKKLELVEIGTNLIVKGEMDAAKKNNFVRGSAFALWQELTEEMQKLCCGELCCRCSSGSYSLAPAAV